MLGRDPFDDAVTGVVVHEHNAEPVFRPLERLDAVKAAQGEIAAVVVHDHDSDCGFPHGRLRTAATPHAPTAKRAATAVSASPTRTYHGSYARDTSWRPGSTKTPASAPSTATRGAAL